MYCAFTVCVDGTRHFAHVSGLDISYDPRLIRIVVDAQTEQVQRNRAHITQMEKEIERLKEMQNLPPIVGLIVDHNRRTVDEQEREKRRLALAEAVVNGALVREVQYFEDIPSAIRYTRGNFDA